MFVMVAAFNKTIFKAEQERETLPAKARSLTQVVEKDFDLNLDV